MLYYLDTVVVIYAVEGTSADQLRAQTRLTALERAGHQFVLSELTQTECLALLFQPAEAQRLSEFFEFFHGSAVRIVPLTAAMHHRGAAIRGGQTYRSANPQSLPKRYSLADALHLAAAIESGCDRFLTNDQRLTGFPDVTVEVLP